MKNEMIWPISHSQCAVPDTHHCTSTVEPCTWDQSRMGTLLFAVLFCITKSQHPWTQLHPTPFKLNGNRCMERRLLLALQDWTNNLNSLEQLEPTWLDQKSWIVRTDITQNRNRTPPIKTMLSTRYNNNQRCPSSWSKMKSNIVAFVERNIDEVSLHSANSARIQGSA